MTVFLAFLSFPHTCYVAFPLSLLILKGDDQNNIEKWLKYGDGSASTFLAQVYFLFYQMVLCFLVTQTTNVADLSNYMHRNLYSGCEYCRLLNLYPLPGSAASLVSAPQVSIFYQELFLFISSNYN